MFSPCLLASFIHYKTLLIFKTHSTNIPSENSHVPSSVQSNKNDEDTNNVEVPKKKKSGRKVQWSEYVLNYFIDIVASSEYYQRKLIFTNTKHQQNVPIYGESRQRQSESSFQHKARKVETDCLDCRDKSTTSRSTRC